MDSPSIMLSQYTGASALPPITRTSISGSAVRFSQRTNRASSTAPASTSAPALPGEEASAAMPSTAGRRRPAPAARAGARGGGPARGGRDAPGSAERAAPARPPPPHGNRQRGRRGQAKVRKGTPTKRHSQRAVNTAT